MCSQIAFNTFFSIVADWNNVSGENWIQLRNSVTPDIIHFWTSGGWILYIFGKEIKSRSAVLSQYLCGAEKHSFEKLLKKADKMILVQFSDIRKTEEFHGTSFEILESVLEYGQRKKQFWVGNARSARKWTKGAHSKYYAAKFDRKQLRGK